MAIKSITELNLLSKPNKNEIIDLVLTERKDNYDKRVYTIDSIVKEWLREDIKETSNDSDLGKLIREKYGI